MIVRIELNDTNHHRIPILNQTPPNNTNSDSGTGSFSSDTSSNSDSGTGNSSSDTSSNSNSGTGSSNSGTDSSNSGTGSSNSDTGASGAESSSAAGYSLPEISLSLLPVAMADYDYSHYTHPAFTASAQVPEADMDAVAGWTSSPLLTGASISDTLAKRLTESILGNYNRFVAAASRAALFTSPFRLGCAVRLADGTHTLHSSLRLVVQASRPPLLLAHERQLQEANSGGIFSCVTEIVGNASRLLISMAPFTLPTSIQSEAVALDFYATKQTSLLAGDEKVTGIRTFQVAGENYPGWLYPRMSEANVSAAALADTSFRVIGSIDIATAAGGVTGLRLPAESANLQDWAAFPAIDLSEAEGDGTGIPGSQPGAPDQDLIDYDYVKIETEPLHLGNPEAYKRVFGVSLRGIFDRSAITFTLYGSLHRDRWHPIATARGAHLRLLHGVSYRWLKVVVWAAKSDSVEALSFNVAYRQA